MPSQTFKIETFDTTLRDGAQSLPVANQLRLGDKARIAGALAEMGIQTIEAGFAATPSDAEQIRQVAETVGRTEYLFAPRRIVDGELVDQPERLHTPCITGLSRAVLDDIEKTWEAVQAAHRPGIHLFVTTSEENMQIRHGTTDCKEIVRLAVEAVRHARHISAPGSRIEFSCEHASTSETDFLEEVVKSVLQEDIDVINLPDTLGAASEHRISAMFRRATGWLISEGCTDVIISAHNHNDGARAVANTIAAAHAVVDTALEKDSSIPVFQAEVTNGPDLGERNGNTNFAPFAQAVLLDAREFGVPVKFDVDTKRVVPVAQLIADRTRIAIPPRTPVIGTESMVHRSGVHSNDIVRGGAHMYSIVDPRWFGHGVAGIIENGMYQGATGRNNQGEVPKY